MRSYLTDNSRHLSPEPGAFAVESCALAGCANVLAREASRNHVNNPAPRPSVKGANVIPNREGREKAVILSLGKNACGVGFPLDGANCSPSEQVPSKYSATSACEKSQLIHSVPSCAVPPRLTFSASPFAAQPVVRADLSPEAAPGRSTLSIGIIWLLLITAGVATKDVATLPTWVIYSCYFAIAWGTYLGGWRIVKTMGTKITKLNAVSGSCASMGGAITLGLATLGGIPVSTTHTITGAIIGVGAATDVKAVRWAITMNLLVAWILTIPASGLIAAIFWYIGTKFL